MRLRQGRAAAGCRHFLPARGSAGGAGGRQATSPDMSSPFVLLPAANLPEQPRDALSAPLPPPALAVPISRG